MIKEKLKISGGFQSLERAQSFAIIRSIIQTCRKQDIDVLKVFQSIMCGENPFIKPTELKMEKKTLRRFLRA